MSKNETKQKKRRNIKTPEELVKNPIIKHIKLVNNSLYAFQLIGILMLIFLPLWMMVIYEVCLFVAHEIINDLYKESVWACIRTLAEVTKVLIK